MTTCGGWEAVLQAVRREVGASAFEAWFRSLEGTLEGGNLVIRCSDRFSRDWIRGRYGEVLDRVCPQVASIEYRVDPREAHRSADPRGRPEPARPRGVGSPAPRPATTPAGGSPGGLSFDSFVACPGNALALEAARAVARGEAGRCTPLVLTGSSGVGKTHLCRAIQRELGTGTVYRSSEEFTSEVTHAIRSDRMPAVRHRYRRSLNVLLLEDVQFLQGKRATQMELFHTLDHLIQRGRSVVLTSDHPPHELQGLEPRLLSRMTSGLVARIGPPELPARLAILRAKAAGGGVRIPEPALALLARRPVESARDLLAGLNQVVARATLLKQPITAELVAEALAAVQVPGRRHSLDEIVELVARAYSIEGSELRGRSRKRRVARPRQLAMYLCRRYTRASLKEIGRALARDHTSVLYAIDAVEKRALEEPQLRYELEALTQRLG